MTRHHVVAIAGPEAELTSTESASLLAELSEIRHDEPRWLARGEACDIAIELDVPEEAVNVTERLRRACTPHAIDIAIVPNSHRRKRLLVADMESTIIRQECLDELAEFVGLRDRVSDITARAMRGELDFEAAIKARVSLLKGLSESVLEQVMQDRVELVSGARALVQTMRADGAYCVLVSGGFTYFSSRVSDIVGFHEHQANELKIENRALTGEVQGPILGREAKLTTLDYYCSENGLRHEEALAVGDGANDLTMIKAAGLGVAYHAKPVVAAEADVQISHTDLTALLYLQGYNKEEFVS